MKVVKKQTNSYMCFICGIDNDSGLKANFYEMEDGYLKRALNYIQNRC